MDPLPIARALTPISRALTPGERLRFGWLNNPALQKICYHLEDHQSDSVRFVGGCVRDSLILEEGASPADIDLATKLDPYTVSDVLTAAGIKVVPTGIDHGTITAILDGQVAEITTLRRDVSTDGRRASIAYTDDWIEDARRRDFTINALYLTVDGVVHDAVGGLVDLAAKKVKFIGDPATRIREDYLRILRFFRFSARFSSHFDQAGLQSIRENLDGIDILSRERIGGEVLRILALPNAIATLGAMEQCGVLMKLWPHRANIEAARRIEHGDPVLMLSALYADYCHGLAKRLRLSKAQAERLSASIVNAKLAMDVHCEKSARALRYRIGVAAWDDAVKLVPVLFPDSECLGQIWFEQAGNQPQPVFTLTGRDLIAAGIKPGPDVSRLLGEIEAVWIERDFPDDARLQEILAEMVSKHQRDA